MTHVFCKVVIQCLYATLQAHMLRVYFAAEAGTASRYFHLHDTARCYMTFLGPETEHTGHGGAAPWFCLPISSMPAQQLVLPFLPEQQGHLVVEQRTMEAHLRDCSAGVEVPLLS